MAVSDTLIKTLTDAGIELFKERSGYPLSQAQRNLEGRTHYVDDKTLRTHNARILNSHVLDEGLIFGIVESVGSGPDESSARVFRPVFFDLFGNVIYRPDLENSFKTSKQANAAFWSQADLIEAVKVTRMGAEQKRNLLAKELTDYEELIKALVVAPQGN